MSYPGKPEIEHTHVGTAAILSLGTPGVIVMGASGLQTNTLGNSEGANFGELGPNSVNPSGTASGIRLPRQNNFRSYSRRNR